MKKTKVLFVSVAFPPKSDAEALQVARYYYYLQKHEDLQIDVVTSAIPTLYMPVDKDLEPYAAGVHQLIHVKLKENRYINYLISRLGLRNLAFPDPKFSFHKQYGKVLANLKEKPDLIYSRAFPISSTIMAYKLKMKFGSPWILHLSDPWADCPIHEFSGNEYRKNDAWERRCFQAADLISLTSQPAISFYQKKYPEFSSKFRFYPNVYDQIENAQEYPAPAIFTGKRKFRMVYTGGIIMERNGPADLLKPLSELAAEYPDIADRIEVIFAGDADAPSRAAFKTYDLSFVKWVGKVSLKEALRLQATADYLLAIDNPIRDPKMSLLFLSKLLDYMLAQKRILLLTTKGSASDEAIQDMKADACAHSDVDAIKTAILNALSAFEAGDEGYLVNDAPPRQYAAFYNAERLYNEIISLIREKTPDKSFETVSKTL